MNLFSVIAEAWLIFWVLASKTMQQYLIPRDYEEEKRHKFTPEGTVNIYVGKSVKTTSIIKKKDVLQASKRDLFILLDAFCKVVQKKPYMP